ncbi:tyrosine-protein phosphatase [Leucobacter ruminantium]|uniref:Tyrosine-protein phosphatase n=1 Tax=Leucobacter ruminantium TaxID=1289170 RepID=A0A939RYG8_9MICO|nr:tyrosine-protein phosphatase [Leucobacter ruminantium]MBO1804414.1 tyrosine-protein phosphatase [Leucobacter ruminantium]
MNRTQHGTTRPAEVDGPAESAERVAAGRMLLDGAHNFRDLGGYAASGSALRPGLLYRADALNALTDADLDTLRGLGIGLVLDLREGTERLANPDRVDGLGVEHRSVPLHDDQLMNAAGVTQPAVDEQYRLYWERFGHRVAEAVGVLLAAERPAVVHCTAGKDRTGVVVAVLLELLGVPRETISADYLVSCRFLAESPFWERAARDYVQAGIPLFTLEEAKGVPRGGIVVEVLDALIERHGSLESFLLAHGIPPESIDRFRARMLV